MRSDFPLHHTISHAPLQAAHSYPYQPGGYGHWIFWSIVTVLTTILYGGLVLNNLVPFKMIVLFAMLPAPASLIGWFFAQRAMRGKPSAKSPQVEQRFRDLMENSSDATLIVNAGGIIVMANDRAHTMFGYSAKGLVGLPVDRLVPRSMRKTHSVDRAAYMDAPRARGMAVGKKLYGLRNNGSEFPVEITLTPIRGEQEVLVAAVITDITEQSQFEAELTAGEERLRKLVETAPVSMLLTDDEGKIILVNESARRMFGYDQDALLGQSVNVLTPGKFQKKHQKHVASFIAQPSTREMGIGRELSGKRQDESEFLIEVGLSHIDTSHGPLVLAVIADISERRKHEDFLRESEERFRKLVEIAPGAILLADDAGKINLVNAGIEHMFGYTRDELIGQSIEIFLPENLSKIHKQHLASFFADPSTRAMGIGRDLTGKRKDGSLFPLEIGLSYFETDHGRFALALLADITDRKQTEASLRENRDKLQTVYDLSPVGISLVTPSESVLDFNPALRQILGMSDEDLREGRYRSRTYIRPDGSVMPPAEFPSMRALAESSVIKDVEIGIVTEDGATKWVSVSAAPTPDGSVVAVTMDITERKRYEQTLEAQAALLQATSDAVIISDMESMITSANDAVENIFGWKPGELVGTSIFKLVADSTDPQIKERKRIVDEQGYWEGETLLRRRDGSIFPATLRIAMIKNAYGQTRGYVRAIKDITESKEAAAQLRASQARMSAVLKALPDLGFVFNGEGAYIDVLSHRDDLLFARVDELAGKTVVQVLPHPQGETILNAIRQTVKGQAMQIIEYDLHVPAGHRWFEMRMTPMPESSEQGDLVVGLVRDITGRKSHEDVLRYQALLLETVSDAIISINFAGEITSWNKGAETLYGWSADEAIGQDISRLLATEYLYGESRASVGEAIVGQGQWQGELLQTSKDGRIVRIQTITNLLKDASGKPIGTVTASRNITRERELQEARQRSEANLRAILDNVAESYVMFDMDKRIIAINKQAQQIAHAVLGSTLEVGDQFSTYLKGETHEAFNRFFGKALKGEIVTTERSFETPAGTRAFSNRYFPVYADDGALLGVCQTSLDVSMERQAEAAIKESERLASGVINSLSSHLCVVDGDGVILQVNKAWQDFANTNPPVLPAYGVGTNYLAICDAASGADIEDARMFAQGLRAVLEEPGTESFEMEYPCHSPTEKRWFQARVTRFSGEGPARAVVAHINITERKLAEIQLAYQASLVDAISDMVISFDRDFKIISWNKAAERTLEWSEDEARGRMMSEFVPIEYLQPDRDALIRAILQEGIAQSEGVLTNRSGTQIPVMSSASAVKDSGGQMIGSVAVIRDITERKQAEEALRENQTLLTNIVDHFPGLVSAKDLTGTVIMINRKFEVLEGPPPAEWVGKNVFELFPKDIAEVLWANDLAAQRAGKALESEEIVAHRDGSLHTYLTTKFPLYRGDQIYATCAISVDITDRKQAEEALREREEQLSLFIEHAPAAIALFDREMRYQAVSQRWLADYNLGDRDIVGESHYEVFPEIPDRWKAIHQRGMQDEEIRSDDDQFDRIDGTTQLLKWVVKPWHTANDMVGGIIIMTEDITERKRTEEALRQAELRKQLISQTLQRTMEGIIRSTQLNQALELVLASLSSVITCDRIVALLVEEDNLKVGALHGKVGSGVTVGSQVNLDQSPTLTSLAHENQLIWLRATDISNEKSLPACSSTTTGWVGVSLIADDVWIGLLCVSTDQSGGFSDDDIQNIELFAGQAALAISRSQILEELQLTQVRLTQAARLATAGEVAAGVAHQINNPLAAVLAQVHLAKKTISEPESKLNRRLDAIDQAARQASRIVQSMLDLGRTRPLEAKLIDVNESIQRALDLIRADIEPSVSKIDTDFATDLPMVMGASTHLEDVWLNLLTNARDALVAQVNGKIAITTSHEPSGQIVVIFSDNGPGFDTVSKSQAFDPFYTTKPHGTGLGLAICHDVVKQHGGTISLDSQPGQGTRFTITLPSASGKEGAP